MDLVVDTWVWETAQAKDGKVECFESVELLSCVCRAPDHSLLIDYDNEIRDEYKNHIRDGLIKYFFDTMTSRGRFKYRGRTRIRLNSRFDPDDMKFIEVAYVHPRAPIVSGDSDFMQLREHLSEESMISDLEIHTPGEILPLLQ